MHGRTDEIAVLHVDDEPALLDVAAQFLERVDDRISVTTATSADGGERLLESETFDCVVSDFDMPGRNGIEFLESVRRDHPELPFILYTGKGSEEVASEAVSAGVTDYLQKERGTEQYELLANRIVNYVERARAERERERHLDAIETAQEGISILDEDGQFVYVNEAYADLYGYEPDEMLGEHWELIYRDEDTREIRDEILPRVNEEGFWHGETVGLRADGTTFIEDHRLSLTGEGGLVCTVRDLSEQRQTERRFEAIFHNTLTFMGLLDPDGTVLEVNERALSFGGIDRSAVVGKPLWEAAWVAPFEESRETVREAIRRARDGDPFRDEIRIQGADREAVIDFSVRPVTDDEGSVALLVPEGRDVTERKRRERRYRTLVDNLPGVVYRCRDEPGWPMEEVSGDVERVTGHAASALESGEVLLGEDVIHPDDRAFVRERVREALDAGEPFELTYCIVTAGGTTKRVWEHGQGVFSSDGDVLAIEGIITDIPDRIDTD